MSYSILIVDDEENVSKLLEKLLFKEGYKTFRADSGTNALKIVEKNEINLVITDIKMPKMDGIELLCKIKTIDPSIKVILITAFATLDTAIYALKMGAKDYITKPFNLEDILLAVNKVRENDYEKSNYDDKLFFKTKSRNMGKVIELIEQVAKTQATVMLYGKTGTGKELAAKAIHELSNRKDKPFIKVNCAAIPDNLLESELFGYEKGAFTGAVMKKPGRFELANGGTILLDEIGDISKALQVKLLRVIQEKEFDILGGTNTVKIDVRIIAATNKNLEEQVKNNLFREDLYYRLNVVPIELPTLRQRKEDINVLVEDFLKKASVISEKPPKQISEEALSCLIKYNWPGNIRELENVIERCVVVGKGRIILKEDLPIVIQNYFENKKVDEDVKVSPLDEVIDNAERDVIVKTLGEYQGNRTRAAEILKISRRSLYRKILKYNIKE